MLELNVDCRAKSNTISYRQIMTTIYSMDQKI